MEKYSPDSPQPVNPPSGENASSSASKPDKISDLAQRTIAFALLTKLLLENGFCPAVLKDPYMFDGYFSTDQMVDMVKEGMEFYTNMA